MGAGGVRLVRLSLRVRVLAPIRGALALAGLILVAVVSGRPATALLAFAVGGGAAVGLLRADPRRRRHPEPEPVPREATKELWSEIARTDVFPSTVGLGLLAAASLVFQALLAALLTGILAGMALTTTAAGLEVAALERLYGGALYVERGRRGLFVERADRD